MFTSAIVGLLAASSFMAQTATPTPVPSPSPAKAKSTSQSSAAKSQSPSPTPKPSASPQPVEQNPADTISADHKPGEKTAAEALPPATPVITLRGVCSDGASASGCTRKITKADFDKLLSLVAPPNQQAQPGARRNLAQRYVELLAIAEAAKKAGVENSPEFALLRLRALTEAYQHQLDEQFRTPRAAEVDAYYKEHVADFESLNLRRIYIPRNDPSGKGTAEEKEAFSKKVASLADEIRDRAAKGEDLEALQKDTYSKLGLTTTPPSTQVGAIRKGSLPQGLDKELFGLTPGGIYKSDEPNAFVIYKVEGRQTLPLDSVKDEIARTLHRRKMEDKLKEITAAVKADYNDTYFGPATAAAATPPADKR
jgi:PPIC-type PPIASE domain